MALDLNALLRARSVAVIGASAKRESFGWNVVRQLLDFEYPGEIFPVNPRYAELEGLRCYPELTALPRPVDLAAICVADERIESALLGVAQAGIPAAVIFGSAAGNSAQHGPLTDRLAQIARDADIALMGASCMGFFSFTDRLFVTGYPYHRKPAPGVIAFITHSGSTLSAVAKNTRGMNFNYVISPGQELVLSAADYLEFVLNQPETRVVGLFLEAIRAPERFVAALRKADAREIPIVLLKVGRSDRGARMAMAHTGALAGAHAAIAALAHRHGVTLVRTMEELLDTLELFASGRRATTNALGAITDSGGERGMMVDLATDLGVSFAELSGSTLAVLEEHLDPGLEPGNPADLWGSGRDWQQSYRACIGAMFSDPAVGAFNFGIDFNVGSRLGPDYRSIAIETRNSSEKPFAVISNVAGGLNPVDAGLLREAGVPVLEGTETGLLAFRNLFAFADHVSRRGAALPVTPAVPAEVLVEVRRDRALTEAESMSVLSAFGLRAIASMRVNSPDAAQTAARKIGYPVVLKTAMPGVLHKSDKGGVWLNLESDDAVARAYAEVYMRFGVDAVVQCQADRSAGVELLLGMNVDAQFGPLVSVGIGGVWVEVIEDVVTFLAPCSAAEIIAGLPRLRGYPMLAGKRGQVAVDITALGGLVQQFSAVGAALAPYVAEIDINPVLAVADEFTMLDALVVPAGLSNRDAASARPL